MRQFDKPTLLRWIYRSEYAGIQPFRDVLQQGATEALRKDVIGAEAYVESNLNSFWGYLMKAQEADERRGISRIVDIVDPMAMTMRWYTPPINQTLNRRMARLRHRPATLKMIDTLTDREFEALACVAMTFAGASNTNLTPAGNEGGVDFFSLIPSPGRCHLFSGGVHPLRIIGQAKKYSGPVPVDKMKEFLTTINEVKHGGEAKTEKVVPAWFHSVRGPIVGLMVAHSGFQAGAETRARRHGVITSDSLDLAELLTLSRFVPAHLSANEHIADLRSRTATFLGQGQITISMPRP